MKPLKIVNNLNIPKETKWIKKKMAMRQSEVLHFPTALWNFQTKSTSAGSMLTYKKKYLLSSPVQN